MYFVGPSWFTGSSLFRLGSSVCLPSLFFFSQEKGSVPSWISLSLFVLAGVSVLVSLLLSSSFLKKRVLFHNGFPGSSCFGLGFWCLSPFFFFSQKTGVCQTVPWILICTWPWWKHAMLLFGVYAGVIWCDLIRFCGVRLGFGLEWCDVIWRGLTWYDNDIV